MKRSIGILVGLALAVGLIVSSHAQAKAAPCIGTWTIGIGGFTLTGSPGTWESSSYIKADEDVAYNSTDPASGVARLDAVFWQHRSACPADHIKIVGHSEGAGIVHAWVTQHRWITNANTVLLSDPKSLHGPGIGYSIAFFGWPLGGVDADFGLFPVLSVCNHDDVICNSPSGWTGYVSGGAHQRYDFNAFDYSNSGAGLIFH